MPEPVTAEPAAGAWPGARVVPRYRGPVSDDTAWLDATAQAELVRTKEVSPAELVDEAIARIEALNPQLNAVIHELFDRARTEAAGELPDGPVPRSAVPLEGPRRRAGGDAVQRGDRLLG